MQYRVVSEPCIHTKFFVDIGVLGILSLIHYMSVAAFGNVVCDCKWVGAVNQSLSFLVSTEMPLVIVALSLTHRIEMTVANTCREIGRREWSLSLRGF